MVFIIFKIKFVEDLCSHRKSVKIYMESLRNPKAFPAHKCFNNKKDNEVIYFGDSIPPNM